MANDRNETSHITILIINDDPDEAKLFEFVFRKFGYKVVVAYTGASGLNITQTQHVDLIFIDELLPDLIATEFVQQFRSNKPIPIIVSSTRESKIVDADDSAFSYVVVPPIDIHELKRHTQEALAINNQVD